MFFCPPQKKVIDSFQRWFDLRVGWLVFGFKCSVCRVVATQRFFIFTPKTLGFHDPILTTAHIFFKMGWLVQPPTLGNGLGGAHNQCPHGSRTIDLGLCPLRLPPKSAMPCLDWSGKCRRDKFATGHGDGEGYRRVTPTYERVVVNP